MFRVRYKNLQKLRKNIIQLNTLFQCDYTTIFKALKGIKFDDEQLIRFVNKSIVLLAQVYVPANYVADFQTYYARLVYVRDSLNVKLVTKYTLSLRSTLYNVTISDQYYRLQHREMTIYQNMQIKYCSFQIHNLTKAIRNFV